MKKTILAMAVPVLLTAGTASASINLHDANGFTVDMGGEAEIQYYKDYDPQQKSNLRIAEADFLITTTIAISESLNVISGMGFKYEDQFTGSSLAEELLANDNGVVKNDELFVGFSSNDFGTLTFGRQLLISDDAGNQKDYELGTSGIDFVQVEGSQVIKWVYDNGMFYAGANVDLEQNIDTKTHGRKITGGRLGVRFAGLDTRVYLYDGENLLVKSDGTGGHDLRGFNVEIDYALGAFDVALSYGQLESKVHKTPSDKVETDVFGISFGYELDERTSFAIGYDTIDDAPKGGTTFDKAQSDSLYANVTYSIHSNAAIYAEVGVANVKIKDVDKDVDTGYVFGMAVTF